MKTRRGNMYPAAGAPMTSSRKRVKRSFIRNNSFNVLPDDIVLSILVRVSSTADSPADFISALLTCRRFNCLGLNPLVLSKASAETFAVKAEKWSPSAHRFFQRCSDAGNVEAAYTLGMIQFYCFQNRRNGAALMAKAAIRSHAPSLYSLAIIQFNGSGGTKNVKDLIGGVTLCARAAFLGHIDALRELGHCLKDGYGIGKNITEGQRFLIEANARELASVCSIRSPELMSGDRVNLQPFLRGGNANSAAICSQLISDFGISLPSIKSHPSNRFLTGWFGNRVPDPLLRVCSYRGCGRPETRMHEFRRCSVCGVMNYCSRGCQARDWTMGHNKDCRPMVRVENVNAGGR
ncbi:putative Zinc finger, MYND-type, tetratricopeptide-like helical domain superfamily [Helianthus annuus]|uniref:Putative F-box domain, Zinc finger, MYND-type, Tetratricopeptide-like helical domain protein n=1 Tax=Helianthus annuus TaxID=4232 RepID=A0A251UHA5_HELAN|nr:F-box protein At1g67340 [Helianthus annuus]KAF5801931.1 putative Zinc finger, MYND-type, tetratricopeptide-like helical domain superfamily [Helianthus annuus]KAJ0560166.1 putative F-box protein [Helianthus annuus]KAJ0566403.1 putative Zinc finger, MYND-type, tetratricopeptide-like helical domain superfamily [Helianthus annuus]KAJ0573163.1 putative F-box protein [Helianthus annuus]KAJ0737583.1 putative F-box protein [Helianthus annuus]